MYALLQYLLHICCIKPRKRTLHVEKSSKVQQKMDQYGCNLHVSHQVALVCDINLLELLHLLPA